MQASVFSQFAEHKQEFVLYNASDDPIEFSYQGETRIVPGRFDVAPIHPKFKDVPHSAEGPDGKLVPGTLVISDVLESYGRVGGQTVGWSAKEAIKYVLQIDSAGNPSGPYFQRGLTLLPKDFTLDDVEALRREALPRIMSFEISRAKTIIAYYEEKNKIRKSLNLGEEPKGQDYVNAQMILDAAKEKSFEKARRAFEEPKEDADLDLLSFAKEKLLATAKKLSAELGKEPEELAEELATDPEILAKIKEKYNERSLKQGAKQ
jgi:hypothetical protein